MRYYSKIKEDKVGCKIEGISVYAKWRILKRFRTSLYGSLVHDNVD
jgi:hypothetical protein